MPKVSSACFIVHEWSRSSLLSGASAVSSAPLVRMAPTSPALLVVQATVKKKKSPGALPHFMRLGNKWTNKEQKKGRKKERKTHYFRLP